MQTWNVPLVILALGAWAVTCLALGFVLGDQLDPNGKFVSGQRQSVLAEEKVVALVTQQVDVDNPRFRKKLVASLKKQGVADPEASPTITDFDRQDASATAALQSLQTLVSSEEGKLSAMESDLNTTHWSLTGVLFALGLAIVATCQSLYSQRRQERALVLISTKLERLTVDLNVLASEPKPAAFEPKPSTGWRAALRAWRSWRPRP